MDSEGNCLVVSPCFSCKQAKNGVQVCLVRKHNARLTAVMVDDLTSRHRMCVKPDQSMTIFKLVDRETGEESVEYAKDMVFQRPCDGCQHLKSCIMAGHPLQDWATEGNDNRIIKRKSMSSTPKSTGASSPSKSQSKGSSSSSREKTTAAGITSTEIVASPATAAIKGRSAEGNHRPKRRKTDTVMASSTAVASEPKANVEGNTPGKGAGSRSGSGSRSAASSRPAPGRGGAAGAVSGGGGGTTAETIAVRLHEMTAAEDLLRQQFQTDMQSLDKAEMAKLKEIEEANAALERIRLIRKATRDKIEEQRKDMSAERQRLTHLRVKAIIREEEELRRRNEALWTACEASAGFPLGSTPSSAANASAREGHGRPARAGRAGRSSARRVRPTMPVPAAAAASAAAAPTPNGCSSSPPSSSSVSIAQHGLEVTAAGGEAVAGGFHVINPWAASGRAIGGGRGNDGEGAESEGTEEEGDINVEAGGTHEDRTVRGHGDGLMSGEADSVSEAGLEEGSRKEVDSGEGSGGEGGAARAGVEEAAETRAVNENGSLSGVDDDEDEDEIPAEVETAMDEEKEEGLEDRTTEEMEWTPEPEENGGPSRGTDGKRDGEEEAKEEEGLVGNVGALAEREEDEVEVRGSVEDAPIDGEAFGVAGPGRAGNGGGSEAKRGTGSESSSDIRGKERPAARDELDGVDGDVRCEDEEEERVDVGGSPVGGGVGGEVATR